MKNIQVKESTSPHQYELDPKRWLVLASFSLLSTTSAWVWISWSPMVKEVAEYWDVTEASVNQLSGVYMYIYVLGSFFSIWLVVNVVGLAQGLWMAALLNLAGSVTRLAGMHQYGCVYAGTVLCAMAQTFTLATPPLIAGNWFGSHERATATAVGVLANQFGTALGLGSTIVFDLVVRDPSNTDRMQINETRLQSYLQIQCLFACLATVMLSLFVTADRPPTPPSAAAAFKTTTAGVESSKEERAYLLVEDPQGLTSFNNTHTKPLNYYESVKVAVTEAPMFVLLFGISIGTFYTIPTFLSQLAPAWTAEQCGWLGVLYQIAGVAGSFVSGRILDVFSRHHLVSSILLGGGAVSLCIFLWAIDNDQSTSIFVGIGSVGFCLAAFNTVGFELGTALTYPADEAAVAGLLECTAELCGYLLVTIGGIVLVNEGTNYFILILLGMMLGAQWLLQRVRADPVRPTD